MWRRLLGRKEGGVSGKIVCIDASPGPYGIQAAKARTAAVQASKQHSHLGDFAIRIHSRRKRYYIVLNITLAQGLDEAFVLCLRWFGY